MQFVRCPFWGFRHAAPEFEVTARLCQELRRAGIESIGLNVKADNRGALACYEKMGFERIANYGEFTLEQK